METVPKENLCVCNCLFYIHCRKIGASQMLRKRHNVGTEYLSFTKLLVWIVCKSSFLMERELGAVCGGQDGARAGGGVKHSSRWQK